MANSHLFKLIPSGKLINCLVIAIFFKLSNFIKNLRPPPDSLSSHPKMSSTSTKIIK